VAVGEGAVNFRALDQHVFDAAGIDVGEQLGERNVRRLRVLAGTLEQREQRQQQEDDDHPKGEIAQIGIHLQSLDPRICGAGAYYVPANRGGFTSPIPQAM
jgi:hypothetical protein